MSDDKKVVKICFDIDGSLIHQGSPDYLDSKGEPIDSKPRYTVLNLYKALELLDVELYLWSNEGKAHAKLWRKRLGLKGKVVEKGSFKPDIAIDNHEDLGKVTIFV